MPHPNHLVQHFPCSFPVCLHGPRCRVALLAIPAARAPLCMFEACDRHRRVLQGRRAARGCHCEGRIQYHRGMPQGDAEREERPGLRVRTGLVCAGQLLLGSRSQRHGPAPCLPIPAFPTHPRTCLPAYCVAASPTAVASLLRLSATLQPPGSVRRMQSKFKTGLVPRLPCPPEQPVQGPSVGEQTCDTLRPAIQA